MRRSNLSSPVRAVEPHQGSAFCPSLWALITCRFDSNDPARRAASSGVPSATAAICPATCDRGGARAGAGARRSRGKAGAGADGRAGMGVGIHCYRIPLDDVSAAALFVDVDSLKSKRSWCAAVWRIRRMRAARNLGELAGWMTAMVMTGGLWTKCLGVPRPRQRQDRHRAEPM